MERIEFGKGNIMMSLTSKLQDGFMELYFSEVESGEIGLKQRELHKEKTTDELNPVAIFRFNKIESVKALRFQLNRIIKILKADDNDDK